MKTPGGRTIPAAFLMLTLAACHVSPPGAGRAGESERPNILLVTLDTTRADLLGPYGDPDGHTPHLDRFARRATVFEQATAPIGTTVPSHLSAFTGIYPRRHGVRNNRDAVPPELTTLAEVLADAGYATAAFSSKSFVLRGGLVQGFQQVEYVPGKGGSRSAAEEAARWLESPPSEPFFAWVHLFDAHSPYRLRPYSRKALREMKYDGPLSRGIRAKGFQALSGRTVDDIDVRALRALYAGELRLTDELVGRIVEVVERSADERTMVIVAADHGQLLGEHRDVGHGFVLWEEVLRVPLLVRLPGQVKSRRVATRVGLVDLVPTLTQKLQLHWPSPVDGRSILPLLQGEEIGPAVYWGESRTPFHSRQDADLQAQSERIAIYYELEKGILSGEGFVAYELEEDPGETRPIGATERSPRQTQMAEWSLPALEEVRAGTSEAGLVSPEIEAELRALGYVR